MQYATLNTSEGLNEAVADLLWKLIDKDVVQAVMVPTRQPHQRVVMQSLIADPEGLKDIEPFAPVVTTSAAKQVAALTFRPAGRPVAVVLRSCEHRAAIELAKLHQSHHDDLLVIGLDCYGRFENNAYLGLAAEDDSISTSFVYRASGGGATLTGGVEITTACQMCEHPVADNVDLRLAVVGTDATKQIWVEALTDAGRQALQSAGLDLADGTPDGRTEAIAALVEKRLSAKAEIFAEFEARTDSVDGLQNVLAGCINCYNCRVACPVCYCRECVFVTDTFRHDGEQFMAWADKRGQVKLPTDTTFYHLTRMVHMSTLCVGCGQCSSACPNDLPIVELFRTVSEKTQKRFSYEPGADPEEPQPLATFHDEEFGEVTGQTK